MSKSRLKDSSPPRPEGIPSGRGGAEDYRLCFFCIKMLWVPGFWKKFIKIIIND